MHGRSYFFAVTALQGDDEYHVEVEKYFQSYLKRHAGQPGMACNCLQ